MHCQCTAPEEWRAVVGYEGLYEVSTLGNIRRLNRDPRVRPWKLVKPFRQWHGYLIVSLSQDHVAMKFTVHSVVAAAFIGPRPDGLDINHIDGDKENNRPTNLEYVTRRAHVDRTGASGLILRGSKIGTSKLTEDDVRAIRSAPITHGMQSELARRYGVRQGVIWSVINRKTWKHVP